MNPSKIFFLFVTSTVFAMVFTVHKVAPFLVQFQQTKMKKEEATGSVLSVSSTVYRIVFLGNIVSIHWVSFRVAMNKKILISLFVVACKFIRISKNSIF